MKTAAALYQSNMQPPACSGPGASCPQLRTEQQAGVTSDRLPIAREVRPALNWQRHFLGCRRASITETPRSPDEPFSSIVARSDDRNIVPSLSPDELFRTPRDMVESDDEGVLRHAMSEEGLWTRPNERSPPLRVQTAGSAARPVPMRVSATHGAVLISTMADDAEGSMSALGTAARERSRSIMVQSAKSSMRNVYR